MVTKFILPTIDDGYWLILDSHCNYLNNNLYKSKYPVQNLPYIKNFCLKIVPFVYYYMKQIDSYSKIVHNILMKGIPLILPNFQKKKKERRGIITSLVTGFIGLAYEGISSYLHNKRQKALQRAFIAVEKQVNLERNKIFHFEDQLVMYGICNSETIEKLINMIQHIHNKTWNEKLFVGKLNNWYYWYLSEGALHYAINSILYITTLREKYIKLYEKFINQLQMYANAISVLLEGFYQFLFCLHQSFR